MVSAADRTLMEQVHQRPVGVALGHRKSCMDLGCEAQAVDDMEKTEVQASLEQSADGRLSTDDRLCRAVADATLGWRIPGWTSVLKVSPAATVVVP